MDSVIRLKLPIVVWVSAKKEFRVNLNAYRTAHFQVLNKAKIAFKEQMLQYRGLVIPFPPPYLLTYRLFWENNRQLDTNNILSVADKFACDALVEYKVLKEDHKKIIAGTNFRWGGISPGNSHIIMEIHPFEE
jgi:hypothetical protein